MSGVKFEIKLKLIEKYLFQIDFGEFGNILTDEPEPLGDSEGPNPVRMLGASVANCLAASLVFAVRKFKDDPGEVTATVSGEPVRVDGRWRVECMQVSIHLGNAADDIENLQRALDQFESFCVVTQSVRDGIEVNVNVYDGNDEKVK